LKTPVEIAAKKHKEWVQIVKSFGCNETTSEDIVQTMYLKLILYSKKGTNFMYNNKEVNYYYIFKILRGLFGDLVRKEKKIKHLNIDDIQIKNTFTDINYNKAYKKVNDKLKKIYWYDKKVFNLIQEGESILQLSKKTNIGYSSLYNTYNKVKKQLKNEIRE
tara:strand:- start:1943 stop:2428 length:486 start_codon:yes stop_codon:yes gene_type:complete